MNIFLSSYLNNNLGDDLMIYIMCKRYPKHQFYISNTNELEHIACKVNNLHIIPSIYPSKKHLVLRCINKAISFLNIPKLQVIKEFKRGKYDIYIELGGSIYMQVTKKSWINKVRDSLYISNKCKYNFVISSNFGPYQTKAFKTSHKEMFKKFDDIVFRDKYSYRLFSELQNVRICPDIVFNLDYNHKNITKKIIGFSLISLTNKGIISNKDIYIQGIVDLINILGKEHKIVLFSFCENEGDLNTCNLIKTKCDKNIDINIFNHSNVEESLNCISSFSAMISTRFHACVLAARFDIPFLPVTYSKKTDDMLNDLGYKGYRWNIKIGEYINIDKALNSLNYTEKIDYNIMAKSKNHFIKLDKILLG